jgi:putative ABC transport system permease protein
VFGLQRGLQDGSPWPAVGVDARDKALDLDVRAGSMRRVGRDAIAVSQVFASSGHLGVGDRVRVALGDHTQRTFSVAAIYARAAGLGDVVLDPALARAHASVPADSAVFVSSGGPALARYAASHPAVRVLDRPRFLASIEVEGAQDRWGIWMIIALAAGFAALALVNTAAMSTGERRKELATVRLLGGTNAQAVRMVALEMVPTIAIALAAGAAVVGLSLAGVPRGITGESLSAPLPLIGGLVGGAVALGLLTSVVCARIAVRASPAEAMRAPE